MWLIAFYILKQMDCLINNCWLLFTCVISWDYFILFKIGHSVAKCVGEISLLNISSRCVETQIDPNNIVITTRHFLF